jgi:hypothetical protein
MSNEELERQYQAFANKYEKRIKEVGLSTNVEFGWYRAMGEPWFEEAIKKKEKEHLAESRIIKSDAEDAWRDMRDKGMNVKEYIRSKQEQEKKQNKFVSSRIENGNTLYLKTEGGAEIKVKFRPFDAEDGGEEFKRYSWETDNGDDHLLTIFYGYDFEYEINDAQQFSLPITDEQGNALRAQLDEYVANELGGGRRRRRRRQQRKTRRTKASRRRRQTRARRVRN